MADQSKMHDMISPYLLFLCLVNRTGSSEYVHQSGKRSTLGQSSAPSFPQDQRETDQTAGQLTGHLVNRKSRRCPANNIYGTHIGPIWDSIWVLYGYPLCGQYGICNWDTTGTHMGWLLWTAYGSYMGQPTSVCQKKKNKKTFTHFYTNDYKSPFPDHLLDW